MSSINLKRSIVLSRILALLILLSWANCLTAAKKNNKDVEMGKRLFLGLLPHNIEHQSCVSCHNLAPSDTLNWNPSAIELTTTIDSLTSELFYSKLMDPIGVKISESHKGIKLNKEEINQIYLYLKDLKTTGLPPPKPTHNNLILFLLLGAIITFGLIDLIFTHKVKYRFLVVATVGVAFLFQVKMVAHTAIALGRSEGYGPDQPIKFSHKIHADENKIDCKYCHNISTRSKSGGIPSANLCLNCHSLIREGTNSGQFEINKIHYAIDNNQPIEWIRVHHLADHAFFSHEQHVEVANQECSKCHGEVKQMHILYQHSDLSMGWCVKCHRDTEVDIKNNDYYKRMLKQQQNSNTLKEKYTADDLGSNGCMKCHY